MINHLKSLSFLFPVSLFLLLMLLTTSACTFCVPEEESNEKEWIHVTIPNARVERWGENLAVAYVNWGTQAVTPTFDVSSTAAVEPASGETQSAEYPIVYTITAEDGSVARCTLVVCQVSWALADQNNSSHLSFTHFGDPFRESWTAGTTDKGIWVDFGQTYDPAQLNETFYGCRVGYRGTAPGVNAGTYQINTTSLVNPGQGFARLHIQNSSSAWYPLIGGQVAVEHFDEQFRTLTGSFDNIVYQEGTEAFPRKVLFGNFKNLPLPR